MFRLETPGCVRGGRTGWWVGVGMLDKNVELMLCDTGQVTRCAFCMPFIRLQRGGNYVWYLRGLSG